MMIKHITIDDVLSWGPCDSKPGERYSREGLEMLAERHFGGRDRVTPLDVARCEHLSVEERQWLLLREKVVPQPELGLLDCDFAEHVLCFFEHMYPNDDRPRKCIEVKRRHLCGKATDEELAIVWALVRSAEQVTKTATSSASLNTPGVGWGGPWQAAWDVAWAAWSSIDDNFWIIMTAQRCVSAATAAAAAAARVNTGGAVWSVDAIARTDAEKTAYFSIADAKEWEIAGDAAGNAERRWQLNRVVDVLEKLEAAR